MTGPQLLAMWSQIAAAALFVVLAVVIWNKFIAPGVQTYTAAKNAEIKEAEERRERCRHECHEAHAEVARAEDDAREIHARIDVVAAREREQAVALARAEADRIVRNAEGELERQRIAARDRLRIEFIEKALAKARDEATRRVDDAANIRLVDATVNDLTRRRG